MKNLLSEYDVNEKLLTNKERQEIDAMHDTLKEMLENKIRFMWDELLQREEVVMERIAQHVGFDGYDTGAFNYREQYQKLILKEDLDEQVKQKLMEFSTCKMKDDEYIKLAVDVEELKKYEAGQRQWLKQQYLNRILTATRQRMEKYQSDGKPFMPVKAYNALPVGEKEKLRRAVSETIKLDDGSRILLDKTIAGRICRLWVAGITTGASCSGMVIDHPYHRHEEDDRFGAGKRVKTVSSNRKPARPISPCRSKETIVNCWNRQKKRRLNGAGPLNGAMSTERIPSYCAHSIHSTGCPIYRYATK